MVGNLSGMGDADAELDNLFTKGTDSTDGTIDLGTIEALFQDFEDIKQARIFAQEYDLYQSFLNELREEAKKSKIVDLGNDPASTAVSSSANLEVLMKNLYDPNSALSEPAKEVFAKAYHTIAEDNDLEHKELVIPTSITQDTMVDTLSQYLRMGSEAKLALMYLLSPTHDDEISKYIASRFKDRRTIAELTIQIDNINNQLIRKGTSVRKNLVPQSDYNKEKAAREKAEKERDEANQSLSDLEKSIQQQKLNAMQAGEQQVEERYKNHLSPDEVAQREKAAKEEARVGYVLQSDLDAANKAAKEAQINAAEAQKNVQDLQARLTEASNNYEALQKAKTTAEKERDVAVAAKINIADLTDTQLQENHVYRKLVALSTSNAHVSIQTQEAEARAKEKINSLQTQLEEVNNNYARLEKERNALKDSQLNIETLTDAQLANNALYQAVVQRAARAEEARTAVEAKVTGLESQLTHEAKAKAAEEARKGFVPQSDYNKEKADREKAEKEKDEANQALSKATSDEKLAEHPLYKAMVEKAARAEARVSDLEKAAKEVKPQTTSQQIPTSLDVTARSPKRTTEATVNDRYLTLFREVGDTSDALDSALTMFYSGDKAVEARYDSVLSQLNTLSTRLDSGLETYLVGDTKNTDYVKSLVTDKADNLRTADYVVAQNKAIALAQKARIAQNKNQLAEAHTVLTQAKLIIEAMQNNNFKDQYKEDFKQTESFISSISIN